MERPLRCRHVGRVAAPDLQGRLLDGAGIGKRHGPRQAGPEPGIHGVQAGRGQFAGLTAREERNPRNGRGNGPQVDRSRWRRPPHPPFPAAGRPVPGSTMLGFRIMPSSITRCAQSWAKPMRRTCSVTWRHCSSVWSPIHQHFRLDDRDQSGFLAQCGVAGQSVRIGLDTSEAGNAGAHGDDRPPLGKARAHAGIFLQGARAIRRGLRLFFRPGEPPCPCRRYRPLCR